MFDSCFIGNPEPEIEWYLNDNIIFEDDKWRMNFFDDGTCDLILKDAQQEDQGKVKCVAFNESGKVSCTGVLYIEGIYIFWNSFFRRFIFLHFHHAEVEVVSKECWHKNHRR